MAAAGRRCFQNALTWAVSRITVRLRHMRALIAKTIPRLGYLVRDMPPEWRLYSAAILLYLGALIISKVASSPTANTILYLITACSLFCFAIGFLTWLTRTIFHYWKTAPGKLAIGLINGLLLLLSVIPARTIVSESIGLSPLDFDYTVAICTLFLYPIVALMLLAVVILVGYFLIALAVAIPSNIWNFVDRMIGLILYWVFSVPKKKDPYIQIRQKSLWVISVHLIGFLVIFLSVSLLAVQAQNSWLKPAVRNIAYMTEYYYLPDYPGIERKLPAKVHTNSVVSYATRDGSWDIEITVDILDR